MTLSPTSGSSSSSAKATLERAIKKSRFTSQGDFYVLSAPSQASLGEHSPPVRSASHDKNGPFAERTPILARKASQAHDNAHKKKLTIQDRIELITLREKVIANGYLTKAQVKAMKDNEWEYPVLAFIESKAHEWMRKNIILTEKLHYIPAEKLEILFGTTWARHFMNIDPCAIFEQLGSSWATIRNFIQQLDDLKKIKRRNDLTDQLLSLYQHKILKMDFSIQYNLDDLIQLIETMSAVRDLNILTIGGSLIQSDIKYFSKRAIDLLFLKQYASIFKRLVSSSPVIRDELILLAKTPTDDPNYPQKMMQIEQILILCSKGRYVRWILENKVLYSKDLWLLTDFGQYTDSQKIACKRTRNFFQAILADYAAQYKNYCRLFRVKIREDQNLFALLGDNKIDIADIILSKKT